MPATAYAAKLNKAQKEVNYFQPKEFKKLRIEHIKRFEKELCSKSANPFHALCSYLHGKRDFNLLLERKGKSSKAADINYEYLVELIPEDLGMDAFSSPKSKRRHNSQLFSDGSDYQLENSNSLRGSHFSDLDLVQHKEALKGFVVPDIKLFNAKECLFEIQYNNAN